MQANLEHANLTVASIEESVAFLSAAFPHFRRRGGGELRGDGAPGQWLHFGDDDTYLALQQPASDGKARELNYTQDGFNHLGFVVDDLDELMQRLEGAGYPLSPMSSLDDHPHRRRAYFNDGNGFEWEFVEYRSEDPAERNDYSI